MPRSNRLAAAVGCVLAVVGVGAIVGALEIPNPHVTAIEVDATVEPSQSGTACVAHGTVQLSFPWHGRTVRGVQVLSRPCDQYRLGDEVVVYVASNDPSDREIKPSAITDPSTVDPFAVVGPNDVNGFLGLFGVGSLVGGTVLYFTEGRRRSSSVPPSPAPSPPHG